MRIMHKNQIHQKPKKEKIVDNVGNAHRRIYTKRNDTTSLFAKGPSDNAVNEFLRRTRHAAKDLNVEIITDFLILPGK